MTPYSLANTFNGEKEFKKNRNTEPKHEPATFIGKLFLRAAILTISQECIKKAQSRGVLRDHENTLMPT